MLSSDFPLPAARCLLPAVCFPLPASRFLLPASCFLLPARIPNPESRIPSPESRPPEVLNPGMTPLTNRGNASNFPSIADGTDQYTLRSAPRDAGAPDPEGARAGARHGYAIVEHLRAASDDVLRVGESALYPALQRLLVKDWVEAVWGVSENNRRARYYTLTPLGRQQLTAERQEFDRLVGAIQRVLHAG
jgi:PadR family transcriptional regulator, regulatory protein PadR